MGFFRQYNPATMKVLNRAYFGANPNFEAVKAIKISNAFGELAPKIRLDIYQRNNDNGDALIAVTDPINIRSGDKVLSGFMPYVGNLLDRKGEKVDTIYVPLVDGSNNHITTLEIKREADDSIREIKREADDSISMNHYESSAWPKPGVEIFLKALAAEYDMNYNFKCLYQQWGTNMCGPLTHDNITRLAQDLKLPMGPRTSMTQRQEQNELLAAANQSEQFPELFGEADHKVNPNDLKTPVLLRKGVRAAGNAVLGVASLAAVAAAVVVLGFPAVAAAVGVLAFPPVAIAVAVVAGLFALYNLYKFAKYALTKTKPTSHSEIAKTFEINYKSVADEAVENLRSPNKDIQRVANKDQDQDQDQEQELEQGHGKQLKNEPKKPSAYNKSLSQAELSRERGISKKPNAQPEVSDNNNNKPDPVIATFKMD